MNDSTDQNQNNQQAAANPMQIQEYLKGVDYPCSKEDLIETAKSEGADENVIQTLQRIPMEEFNSPKEVSEAIGQLA